MPACPKVAAPLRAPACRFHSFGTLLWRVPNSSKQSLKQPTSNGVCLRNHQCWSLPHVKRHRRCVSLQRRKERLLRRLSWVGLIAVALASCNFFRDAFSYFVKQRHLSQRIWASVGLPHAHADNSRTLLSL